MERTKIRFGDRQKNFITDDLGAAAKTEVSTMNLDTEPQEPVTVGLFHDPLDGAGSRSLPTSALQVDKRGYGR